MGRGIGAARLVQDEPVQWHLTGSWHDECPKCGSNEVWYVTRRERWCPACNHTIKLTVTVRSWLMSLRRYTLEQIDKLLSVRKGKADAEIE
jgi:hypothetical protein